MTSPKPSLTVAICTYNRQVLLARCLESLAIQDFGQGVVDVLVVDNNSSDGTAAVVESFAGRLPGLRRVFEREQGLSAARNRAWREPGGDYILYLDDDGVAPPDFLTKVCGVLSRHRPDILGGPVLPIYSRPKPWWFRDEYEIRSYAERSGFLDACRASGGNFCIRRALLGELGLFDTRLGMIGDMIRLGEERALLERYRDGRPPEQRRAYYDLDCFIYHEVPAEKMTLRYYFRRHYNSGRSSVRAKRKPPVAMWKHALRMPLQVLGILARELAAHGPLRADYLRALAALAASLGNIREFLKGGLGPVLRPLPAYLRGLWVRGMGAQS